MRGAPYARLTSAGATVYAKRVPKAKSYNQPAFRNRQYNTLHVAAIRPIAMT